MKRYIHYGWPVSPYTAKTHAYLRFKGIPFEHRVPSALTLARTIRAAVGKIIMPTVQTPEGTWWQDSSAIIDAFEARFESPSIVPPGPSQALASLLLEVHADEWLPAVHLDTRWNIPDNNRFAIEEFAQHGFPWLPGFLGRRAAGAFAKKMQGYMPMLGVDETTRPGLRTFLDGLIGALDEHLAVHPMLLGTRPCLGDFALYGPLWAHIYRDPGSRERFDDAPHVVRWMKRLGQDEQPAGEFLANDEVPATLDPIFAVLFAEQWPFVQALIEHIDRYCDEHPDATRVPRALGWAPFSVGGTKGRRKLTTFSQWKLQRPLSHYAGLTPSQREAADAWLDRVGGQALRETTVANPFDYVDFKMRLRGRPKARAVVSPG